MKVEGLVAIVTGGASGLGEATVKKLIEEGSKVVIADRDEEKGNKLASQYDSSKVIFVKTDVTKEEDVKNVVAKTLEKFGKIHVLVNSAGVAVQGHIFSKDTTMDLFKKVMQINVIGTFNMSKAVAEVMVKQDPIGETKERGVIINVASIAGIDGARNMSIYSASKGAIVGMTLPMARDLGKSGVRVVTIAPGIMETEMAKPITENKDPRIDIFKQITALGRFGYAYEFADACIGMIKSSYISGAIIRLDGGNRFPHL